MKEEEMNCSKDKDKYLCVNVVSLTPMQIKQDTKKHKSINNIYNH